MDKKIYIYFAEHDIYFGEQMFTLVNINLELKSALRTKYLFCRTLLYLYLHLYFMSISAICWRMCSFSFGFESLFRDVSAFPRQVGRQRMRMCCDMISNARDMF